MMANTSSSKNLNKLIIVAALGYFVDIYDLLLFGVERTQSLNEIIPHQFPGISGAVLKNIKRLLWKITFKLANGRNACWRSFLGNFGR